MSGVESLGGVAANSAVEDAAASTIKDAQGRWLPKVFSGTFGMSAASMLRQRSCIYYLKFGCLDVATIDMLRRPDFQAKQNEARSICTKYVLYQLCVALFSFEIKTCFTICSLPRSCFALIPSG